MDIQHILRNAAVALLFSITLAVTSCSGSGAATTSLVDSIMTGTDPKFRPAVEKLLERGADTTFISSLVKHPKVEFIDKMVKINVSGFRKRADYSHNYNEYSIKNTKQFLSDNLAVLQDAEDKYGVPKEVITSILWVETKFGKITGTNHVASVYVSLAAADQTENIEMNKQSYRGENISQDSLVLLDSIVEARAHKKAHWAADQLVALKDMEGKLPVPPLELKGSWAGAFGWSQFIPSSYLSWAADGNNDGRIDLNCKEDAIASVANYLKTNGWGTERKSHEAAVFHYNNSMDYVNCVLTLAEKIAAK